MLVTVYESLFQLSLYWYHCYGYLVHYYAVYRRHVDCVIYCELRDEAEVEDYASGMGIVFVEAEGHLARSLQWTRKAIMTSDTTSILPRPFSLRNQ